jgi:hypothetical protein
MDIKIRVSLISTLIAEWQLHAPTDLPSGKESLLQIGKKATWTPQAVWGLELRPLGRPARRQSLYRLGYRDSPIYVRSILILYPRLRLSLP